MFKDVIKFVFYTSLLGWAGGRLFGAGVDLGVRAANAQNETL